MTTRKIIGYSALGSIFAFAGYAEFRWASLLLLGMANAAIAVVVWIEDGGDER